MSNLSDIAENENIDSFFHDKKTPEEIKEDSVNAELAKIEKEKTEQTVYEVAVNEAIIYPNPNRAGEKDKLHKGNKITKIKAESDPWNHVFYYCDYTYTAEGHEVSGTGWIEATDLK